MYWIINLLLDLFAAFFVILTVRQWIGNWWRYKNFPPGPRGWPIVGNLLQLGPKSHVWILGLSEKYGSVVSLTFGNRRAIVLNDWASVREALLEKGDVFSGRPPSFIFDTGMKRRDIVTSDGPAWKIQKKFMIQNMKQFGFGKSGCEDRIMDSVQMVMDDLDASIGSPLGLQYLFFLPVVNTIWKHSTDNQLSKNDDTSKTLCDMITTNFEGFGNLLVNFLPWLRFVPGGFGFWEYRRQQKNICEFLRKEVEKHQESFEPNHHRDFIDVALQEMYNKVGTENAGKPPHNIDHLVGTLYDLLLGGSHTTSNTLQWGFLYLLRNPTVLTKIQEEIDSVVGRERLPCYTDKLPYLEATIQEIHRCASLFPLSVFHSTTQNTTLHGRDPSGVVKSYNIPSGTIVIQNIYAVHRDPKCWADPDQFRPERFLDDENSLLKSPFLMPFSTGLRHCPGEPMVKMQLFLFFGCLLHKYSFSLPPGAAVPTLEPIVGLSLTPKPFKLCVKNR